MSTSTTPHLDALLHRAIRADGDARAKRWVSKLLRRGSPASGNGQPREPADNAEDATTTTAQSRSGGY
jgi:hypothetical protein